MYYVFFDLFKIDLHHLPLGCGYFCSINRHSSGALQLALQPLIFQFFTIPMDFILLHWVSIVVHWGTLFLGSVGILMNFFRRQHTYAKFSVLIYSSAVIWYVAMPSYLEIILYLVPQCLALILLRLSLCGSCIGITKC